MTKRIGGLKFVERVLMASGLVLLGLFAVAMLHRSVSSSNALRNFDEAKKAAAAANNPQPTLDLADLDQVDFALWSEKRVRAYEETLRNERDLPMAVLRIERLMIRVPVYEGTDEFALNRGVGWIAGTARPGVDGNIGIAGHRDGFFRGLKDIELGDTIELSTLKGTTLYKADQFEIVTPDNVDVLRPRSAPSLTLVTCYPFYFVGDAPRRFILHASLNQPPAAGGSEDSSAKSAN